MKLINFITLEICLTVYIFPKYVFTVSMKEFEMTLNSIRDACAPQFKISTEELAKLRKGVFNVENKDIKCYTKCVAQMAGTLNKKGEISFQKSMAQIDMLLPDEMRDISRETLHHCIRVQDNYKNLCDKTYYSAKCGADFSDKFTFP